LQALPITLRTSFLTGLAVLGILSVSVAGCAAEPADEAGAEGEVEEVADNVDALRSGGFSSADMVKIPAPAGMPEPWDQPASTGWFGMNGKCGPTAVANMLRLYGREVSPAQAEGEGVRWIIGTTTWRIRRYFDSHQADLGCTFEQPEDGAAFLRQELGAGHPVMIMYNVEEGHLQAHWVTAVALEGSGDDEHAIVMSWGRYYKMPLAPLVEAWRRVYGRRHPAVVCDQASAFL